jgi:hypothetical protein
MDAADYRRGMQRRQSPRVTIRPSGLTPQRLRGAGAASDSAMSAISDAMVRWRSMG